MPVSDPNRRLRIRANSVVIMGYDSGDAQQDALVLEQAFPGLTASLGEPGPHPGTAQVSLTGPAQLLLLVMMSGWNLTESEALALLEPAED